MPAPYELFLALRYLRFHRGRAFLSMITLISAVGVTVGTAALVIALSMYTGFVNEWTERIHSGSAHLTVMSGEGEATFSGTEELTRRTEAVPGVRAAAAVLFTPAMLTPSHGSPEYAEVMGIDPEAHELVILGTNAGGAGPFAALSGPTESGREGIVLGSRLALRLGAFRGDMVRVVVPQLTLTPWSATPRTRAYELVATYTSDHFIEDSRRAYITLDASRRLLRAGGRSSWVEVRIDDLSAVQPMKERLQAEVGPQWLVVDLVEQNQDIIKALNTEKLVTFLAIGLIVVVAALNIVSTLVLIVNDKVKEIGTLTAMGARPAGIATIFVLHGLVVGFVGVATGLPLGAGIAFVVDHYNLFQLNPEVYYLEELPFETRLVDLLYVGLAAMAISLLATIYPALKASRLDPVEALRNE